MRIGQASVDGERFFVKPPCRGQVAVFQKDIAQIDETERVVRVAIDSLAIGGDGG